MIPYQINLYCYHSKMESSDAIPNWPLLLNGKKGSSGAIPNRPLLVNGKKGSSGAIPNRPYCCCLSKMGVKWCHTKYTFTAVRLQVTLERSKIMGFVCLVGVTYKWNTYSCILMSSYSYNILLLWYSTAWRHMCKTRCGHMKCANIT